MPLPLLRCAFAAIILSCLPVVKAQTSGPVVSAAEDKWAKEPVVLETLTRVYNMNADGTGTLQMRFVVHVQAASMLNQYSVVTVAYASASQKVEFEYVRTRHPDGSVTETPLTGVQEQSPEVTQQAPFYSDLKMAQLPVKNLRAGDRLEWAATVRTLKPETPGEFWGADQFSQGQAVVLNEQLELSFPADKFVRVWTNPRFAILPSQIVENNRRVYRWKSASLQPTAGPEAEAEKKRKESTRLTAEQELDAQKGKLPDVAWTTFHSWDEVGSWYRGLMAGRDEPDAAIKAKVAELTAGKTTETDKVDAVYGYVSTQVRYIGVAFGVGRLQPHTAAAVMDNQYGDCKDKHTLLAAMLRALGMQPDAVLIGAGIRFNEAVPSPASFNHLITQVTLGDRKVWMDSTEGVAPPEALLFPLREQQALVIPPSGPAKIETTPARLPYPAYAKAEMEGTLAKDLTSDSDFALTYRDDDELALRAVLRQVPATQYEELVQRLMVSMGFGGTTSQAAISAVDDFNKPLTISFHYHRVKDESWGENRITLAFLPTNMPVVDETKPPVGELGLGSPRTETSTVEMTLPVGWKAELPEAVHKHTSFVDCDVTYRIAGNKLIAERTLVVRQQFVPAADWKSYKTWYDDAGVSGVPFVQLDPPPGANTAATSDSVGAASSTKAASLVKQAFQAIEQRRFDAARGLLREAEQVNPTEQGLWAAYGYLSFRTGDAEAAVKDYRKELASHPGQSGVYRSLIDTQLLSEHREDAIESARRWMAEDAQSAIPVMTLLNLLREGGRASEAVTVGEEAIPRLPEGARSDTQLQIAMGRAELAAGMRQRGEATLTPLLSSDQPLAANDAAYELADAGLALTADEQTETRVLKTLEDETQGWTLETSPAETRNKTALLTACWDTMGWILFKEGKAAAAEGYIRAAWQNRGEAVVGEHLGDVEESLGRHGEAADTYELAIAASVQYSNLGVRKPPSAQAIALEKKVQAVRRVHPGRAIQDGKAELQKMRVVPLGRGPDASTAEYLVLLSKGKVVNWAPQEASRSLPAAETALLGKADLSAFFPAGSDAQMVRRAMLNCHGGQCEMVLEP